LSPDVAAAVAPLLPPEQFAWYAPYSIAGPDWAQGLIRAAAELAKEDEATALVLAGGTQGWPELDETQWTSAVGFPVRLADDPQDVERGEAVFWLGSAEDGAAYLADLRRLQPQALFALGPAGEDPVFVERYLARAGSLDRVYWTTWTDAGYTDWTAVQLIQSPNAYLAYRAAQAALLAATAHDPAAPPPSWVVQTYRFDPLGNWSPAN
jgi:hypothetical protein